jgi:lysophospholipase L1-like esterase
MKFEKCSIEQSRVNSTYLKIIIKIMLTTILFFLMTFLPSCMQNRNEEVSPSKENKTKIRYLALGDSYTIGQSVPLAHNFPNQLRTVLVTDQYVMPEVKIIATTGWRTDNLKNAIAAAALPDTFDLVTLLIGVNNQYQGFTVQSYEPEFMELLEIAIQKAGGKKEHVIVLSIPDYGATPFGQNNAAEIGMEIDQYNLANKRISDSLGVTYLDITPISREAKTNAALIASDNLHPSALMYERWVELLTPLVKQKF